MTSECQPSLSSPARIAWSRADGMLLSELIEIRSQTASRLSSKSWPAQSDSPKRCFQSSRTKSGGRKHQV